MSQIPGQFRYNAYRILEYAGVRFLSGEVLLMRVYLANPPWTEEGKDDRYGVRAGSR